MCRANEVADYPAGEREMGTEEAELGNSLKYYRLKAP